MGQERDAPQPLRGVGGSMPRLGPAHCSQSRGFSHSRGYTEIAAVETVLGWLLISHFSLLCHHATPGPSLWPGDITSPQCPSRSHAGMGHRESCLHALGPTSPAAAASAKTLLKGEGSTVPGGFLGGHGGFAHCQMGFSLGDVTPVMRNRPVPTSGLTCTTIVLHSHPFGATLTAHTMAFRGHS